MRTAVIGAGGQLGRELCTRLRGEVIPLGRADGDLTDAVRVRKLLTASSPDFVINCAAFNFVDRAETERELAFAVNAWAPHELAIICRDIDCCLVHFGTDYVFGLDQERQSPLSEDDPPGPVSVYGLSKLAGEYLVRANCPKHFVIRTCGLYGHRGSGGKGRNFVETILRLAGEGKPLRIVNDQRCTPSFVADIAVATQQLIQTNAYGLYHATNGGDCSWFEFASEIVRRSGLKNEVAPISSAEFGAPARRPSYSVLSNARLVRAGVEPLRSWQDAVADYLAQQTGN